MPLRNVRLTVVGAAEHVERDRPALREVARNAGAVFLTVRPERNNIVVNAVFDGRGRKLVERVLADARRALPNERIVAAATPDSAHEISAQIVKDKRRGRSAVPGAAQAHEDLRAWEQIIRDVKPRAVLELGTASGAFSKWLDERVAWFRTVDVDPPAAMTPGFVQVDVWANPHAIHDLIAQAPRPFVLYCDDGNKAREVATFAPSLRAGDFLAVHDFGTEIFPKHIPGTFEERLTHGLTGFYELRAASVDTPAARTSSD
jgi:hypothetical protein